MHENISIGTFGLVHNKQMFIISGFIISDPDCTYFENFGLVHNKQMFIISDPDCIVMSRMSAGV